MPKDNKAPILAQSKSKKYVSPVKDYVVSSKKSSPPKKDVSLVKGKRGQPTKIDTPVVVDTKKVDVSIKKTKSKEQIVTVITKCGAAVDQFV